MLDELDAMLAAERAKKKPARRAAVKKPATKVKISYWSQAEDRWKTRWTTCVFKPSSEK